MKCKGAIVLDTMLEIPKHTPYRCYLMGFYSTPDYRYRDRSFVIECWMVLQRVGEEAEYKRIGIAKFRMYAENHANISDSSNWKDISWCDVVVR